jgi:peptidyl-prolyl cis-trans isomerase SurA
MCLLNVSAQDKTKPLIKFKNGTNVSQDEFEYVYQKNNGGYDEAKKHTRAQYEDYLRLYIKFKRKVMEAEKVGIDTTQSFKSELQTYLKQLAQPYLIEKDALDALIKEAYDHWRQAAQVSHILIKVEENATPADTLKAFQKAMAIRDSVMNKKRTFEYLAEQHSDDPSAKENKGYLSYFTAFDFVYPFEKAAFDTPIGQISMPVRSKFGYHLIKVHNRIDAPGVRNTYHILVRFGANYEAKDSLAAKQRIQEVYQKLKNGGDFATLAKEYSDDPKTKTKGGELGDKYIAVPEIQDRKFKLKDKEFSEPFRSQYGYHIIRVTVTDANKTFEDMKKIMRNRVTRDRRAQVAEEKLIAKLKSQYKFEFKTANIDKFIASVQNDYLSPDFSAEKVSKAILDLPIFTFGSEKQTVADLLKFNQKNRNRNTSLTSGEALIHNDIDQFSRTRLLNFEEQQLEAKYPEFRNLKKEYRDGILLFTLTEKMVWRKAVEDTNGLKAYYEKHKAEYPIGERVKIREYRSPMKEMLVKIDSMFNANTPAKVRDSIIADELFAVKTTRNVFLKTDTKSAKFYDKQKGYHSPIESEGEVFYIQYVEDFLPAGVKTFDEAKSEMITKFQTELEKEWEQELEKKYPYKLEEKVLVNLFK